MRMGILKMKPWTIQVGVMGVPCGVMGVLGSFRRARGRRTNSRVSTCERLLRPRWSKLMRHTNILSPRHSPRPHPLSMAYSIRWR